jgi:polynucleotide 5'-hydroxyl-kinase GRC3/NOL9
MMWEEVSEVADTTLLVEGEAEIEVDGTAEVFGCPVKKISVRRGKILPLYLVDDSVVGIKGKYIPIKGSTIPKSWKKLVEEDYKRILLFGESDSGKSSLATYLVNKMDGRKWIVDFDIGQADIAHPAAMGIGVVDSHVVSISSVEMFDGFFVGSISPTGREAKCLRGVAELMDKVQRNLRDGDKVIVDTTGWVRGRRARDYKLAKIEIVKPDVIVCFGEPPYYLSDYNVFEVESFVLKKRSRELRSSIRSEIYSKWLENSEMRYFSVDEIFIGNTTLFKGEQIDTSLIQEIISDVVFVEKGLDFLNICVGNQIEVSFELIKALKELYGVEDVNVFTLQQLEGLLVGLYNERYLGAGIIKRVDLEERKLEILTPVRGSIAKIEFGEIRLDENMRESLVRIP